MAKQFEPSSFERICLMELIQEVEKDNQIMTRLLDRIGTIGMLRISTLRRKLEESL